MSDQITVARDRLHAALVPLLPDGRVHKYVPAQVVSPCMWIERHRWSVRTEGRATQVCAVQLSVVMLADGDDQKQQAWLDAISAAVYDTILRTPNLRAVAGNPRSLDIGGSDNATGMQIDVEAVVSSSTLCRPDQPVAPTIERLTANV